MGFASPQGSLASSPVLSLLQCRRLAAQAPPKSSARYSPLAEFILLAADFAYRVLPPLDSMEHRRHYQKSLEVSECSQQEAQSNTDCAEYSPSMLQQRHGSAPRLLDFHTTDERAIRREARRPARLQINASFLVT